MGGGPHPSSRTGHCLGGGPPPSVGLGTVWVVSPRPRVLCGPPLSVGLGTVWVVGPLPQYDWVLFGWWAPSLSRTGHCIGSGPLPSGGEPPPSVGLGTIWVVGPVLLDIYWILTTLELSRHFVLQCTCV